MAQIEPEYDLVIIGSGAASVPAALVARKAGASVIILEKEPKIGGSTALSGGVIWIANNNIMKRAGLTDSYEAGLEYLNACAGEPQPGSTMERREAYIAEGSRVIDFLEGYGMKLKAAKAYSDYHESEYPGAVGGGRSLVAEYFDLNELGADADRFLRHPKSFEAPITIPDMAQLSISGRTTASKLTYAAVGLRMLRNKMGRQIVGMGAAVQGRLFKIAQEQNIPIVSEAKVTGFLMDGDRVAGVDVEHKGRTLKVKARKGVLINAGGFARNQAMREKYHNGPTSAGWTVSNPGDTGEMIEAAQGLGAGVNMMDLCVWVTGSILPGDIPVLNLIGMAKPHAIMVDQTGRRYVNESTSYVKIGLEMYKRHLAGTPCIPSWLIFDATHRKRYPMANAQPGKTPKEWAETGFTITADTVEALAAKCGIPPENLAATVERFNAFAREGVDRDFHRGRGRLDQFMGDQSLEKNMSLGPIETAPFYAVKAWPTDVGTFGGVVTDEKGRVQREDGSIIPGLYATGNSTAGVSGRSYPGAGASIGASMVFGYLAARDALGVND